MGNPFGQLFEKAETLLGKPPMVGPGLLVRLIRGDDGRCFCVLENMERGKGLLWRGWVGVAQCLAGGGGGGVLSGGVRGGGEDVAEQVIYNMGMAHGEVMVSFWNGMSGLGAVEGEDLVRGTVDMDQGLGYEGILPFQHCIDGPGN